jgi:isopenicillin N synthase-like dioxygenase
MNVLSTEQLDELERRTAKTITVRHPRTKRRYVVLDEESYKRAEPLIEWASAQAPPMASAANSEVEWSEVDNDRRLELIDKKYASRLDADEHMELEELQRRASAYRDRVAPMHNELLQLIAQALELRTKS